MELIAATNDHATNFRTFLLFFPEVCCLMGFPSVIKLRRFVSCLTASVLKSLDRNPEDEKIGIDVYIERRLGGRAIRIAPADDLTLAGFPFCLSRASRLAIQHPAGARLVHRLAYLGW